MTLQGRAARTRQRGDGDPNCAFERADLNSDGIVDSYDIDYAAAMVNGGGAGVTPTRYAYDVENRLISAEPIWPNGESLKTTFAYDYMGRRVAKRVFGYDDANDVWAATPTRERRFIYDGWRPVLELDGADAVVRKYTWGLDLSGSRGGADGVPLLLSNGLPHWRPTRTA